MYSVYCKWWFDVIYLKNITCSAFKCRVQSKIHECLFQTFRLVPCVCHVQTRMAMNKLKDRKYYRQQRGIGVFWPEKTSWRDDQEVWRWRRSPPTPPVRHEWTRTMTVKCETKAKANLNKSGIMTQPHHQARLWHVYMWGRKVKCSSHLRLRRNEIRMVPNSKCLSEMTWNQRQDSVVCILQ